MDFRILLRILIVAFILTLITFQIKYYDDFQGISTKSDVFDSIQGFPFPISKIADPSVILPSSETIDIYKSITFSYLFWVSGIAALVFLKKESLKRVKSNIVLAFICALTLMHIYLSSQSSCIKGYPVKFFSICGDLSANNPVWLFAILDLTFWLTIGIIVIALIKVIEKLPKLLIFRFSYFFTPLVLTILSFVNYISCSGFFCFGPSGRGLPIYYYIESYPPTFSLKYFLLDYIFWLITYLIIKGVWSFISYLRRHK